jgi:catechol 2,3-dioxygenase-like lactoylglutathione lyase family enzyme
MPASQYAANPLANHDYTGERPSTNSHVRLARPSTNLAAAERFYVDGLGLKVLFRLTPSASQTPGSDHQDDLLMLGWPGAAWHLELTYDAAVKPNPTDEDLLVLYVDGPIDPVAVKELVEAGGTRVTARNPYWEQWGITVADPDGYRLVLSQRGWENE